MALEWARLTYFKLSHYRRLNDDMSEEHKRRNQSIRDRLWLAISLALLLFYLGGYLPTRVTITWCLQNGRSVPKLILDGWYLVYWPIIQVVSVLGLNRPTGNLVKRLVDLIPDL